MGDETAGVPAGEARINFAAHQVRAGVQGAREDFEVMISQLVRAVTLTPPPTARMIAANPGDWGIDVVVGELDGAVTVWQSKYFMPVVRESHQKHIRKSFDSVVNNAVVHGFKLAEWILCVPSSMDGPTARWWDKWKRKKEREYDLVIKLWDETELRGLLITDKAEKVRRHYYEPASAPHPTAAANRAGDVSGRFFAGSPPARSNYREQIRQTAPVSLLDRDAELTELADFCTDPSESTSSYQWWRAPKWTGKTALIATFALTPPPGVHIVAFFVTARLSGSDNRAAFINIVGDQLAEILSEPSPITLPPAASDAYFAGLLARAAQACQDRGQRLVLLVDGLDEDRGTPHDQIAGEGHSIAAALPTRPPSGMRIVVTSRPNPQLPADVPETHPLQDPSVVRPLTASPHAKVAADRMLLELQRLLFGSQLQQDLLGLLTAARGGLTVNDMVALTSQLPAVVRQLLRGVTGRTFDTRKGHWRDDEDVYLLGHEDLQVTAVESLGEDRLSRYRQRLHAWADEYRDRGWPSGTPEYLLRGYYRMLSDTEDLSRMIGCATDSTRHDRMLDLSGGDSAALAEISVAQDHILRLDSPDLIAALRLAIHRDHLLERNRAIPPYLPGLWSRHGYVDRAEALTGSIPNPAARAAALAQVAASVGDVQRARSLVDRAETVASSISHPHHQVEALAGIATAISGCDSLGAFRPLLDRAESLAVEISRPDWQSRALAALVAAFVEVGDLDHSERTARRIVDSYIQDEMLARVSVAFAKFGDVDRAETIAQDVKYPEHQIHALTEIAVSVADAGDVERARALLDDTDSAVDEAFDYDSRLALEARVAVAIARIGDVDRADTILRDLLYPRLQIEVLAGMAVADADDVQRASALVDRAGVLAHGLKKPDEQALAFVAIAAAATKTSDPERARALLDRAETTARRIADLHERTSVLAHVAGTLAESGDLVGAEKIIRGIADLQWRAETMANVAVAAIEADELDLAEDIAGHLIIPYQQVGVLSRLAEAFVGTGDLKRARSLLQRARAAADDIPDRDKYDEAVTHVAVITVKMGDLKNGEAIVANDVEFADARNHAFARFVTVVAEAGDVERAETLARDITEPDWRADALVDVVKAMIKIGEMDRAEAVANDITEPQQQISALAQVAMAVTRAGDPKRGRAVLHRAEVIARSVVDPDVQAELAVVIVRIVGDIDRARAIIDGISTSRARAEALTRIAQALAATDDVMEAQVILGDITDTDLRANLLAEMAATVVRAGDIDQARTIVGEITDPPSRGEALLSLVAALRANGKTTEHGDIQRDLLAEGLRWTTHWARALPDLVAAVPAAFEEALRELEALT